MTSSAGPGARGSGAARRAAGLTLVESLAAVALLAAIAGACAIACRDLRAASENVRRRHVMPGLSSLVADGLMQSPSRPGLASLAMLGPTPKEVTLDPALAVAVNDLRSHAGVELPPQDQLDAHAWRLPVHKLLPGHPEAAATPPRRGPYPNWLIVEVDGDISVRCILVADGGPP